MGLTITLANQDITDFVDEDSISIESVLGQGAGGSSQGVGSSTTASFLSDLGPIKSAIGAGQTIPQTHKQVVLSDAPVAYYRMEGEIDCADASGNGQNGSVQHGPLLLIAGATGDLNQAWEADGVAYIQTPLVLTATNNFVLTALVKLLDTASHGPISKLGTSSNGYGMGVGNGTNWNTAGDQLMFKVGATYYTPASPIHIPRDGHFHAVAVKVVGTTASFFLDSVASGTATISAPTTPTGNGYIGADASGANPANWLAIDEVAFFVTALDNGRFGAQFGAIGVRPSLVRLGEIKVHDATGTSIFGGYVTEYEDASLAVQLKTQLDCVDYFQYLDRIEVNEVFTGETDISIIRYIITNYAPDLGMDDIPVSGTYSFDKRYVRAKSVKEALQAIASTTGYAIWVTPDKQLQYKAPTDVSTAPFGLSDDPNFVSTFGYDVNTYTLDDNGTINRVYFYGGKNVSPDFVQDLNPQANGNNKVFFLAYYPHDAADGSIHITKNGVDLDTGTPFSTNPNDKLISDGGTKEVLLNRDAETLTFDVAPLKTDTLTITYRFSTPLVFVISDRSSFQFFGKWLDGKLDDQTVVDSTTAIQRARVLLAQQSYGLESLVLVTHTGGLQAGMLLHVKNTLRGIDDTYLIQKVDTRPEGAGYFEYTVSLGAWNWSMMDLLYAVARRAGVQDTSTEEGTTVIQAQELLDAGDVVDIVTITTTTSGDYYSGHFYAGFATILS